MCESTQHTMLDSVLFNSDIMVAIGPYLIAKEFVNFALTSRRFGCRMVDHDNSTENLSLMGEVARRVVANIQNEKRAALSRIPDEELRNDILLSLEQEWATLQKYPDESCIALYHQLSLLHQPIVFDQLVGKYAQYVDEEKDRFIATKKCYYSSAVSSHVMRAGKHYVELSIPSSTFDGISTAINSNGMAGIMRPVATFLANKRTAKNFNPVIHSEEESAELLGERNDRWGDSNVNCCMYTFNDGQCFWSDWHPPATHMIVAFRRETWDGRQGLFNVGVDSFPLLHEMSAAKSTLGLLLDLDEGTLIVYIDRRRLGVMKEGLTGEYCWAVSQGSIDKEISIKRADIPTENESELQRYCLH